MAIRKIITGACVLVLSAEAGAQGVFDFDEIPGIDDEPIVAVDINPVMLGFVRTMIQDLEPETASMLSGLRSIRLRVYSASNNTRQFNNFIENVTEELEDSSWQRVMFVQDEGANVRVHMQMTETEVSGMTVMMTEGSEAVFINIDGTISAEDLGRLMATLQSHNMLPQLALPSPGQSASAQPAD